MQRKRIIYCVFCLLYSFLVVSAQNKHALLVGLSQYDKKTGWESIHGTNDIDLIKTKLSGFSIKELRNSAATYDNIISELKCLEKEAKEGDTIYIHLSGHGQPVEDNNCDEPDGWDESFIPYDAHMMYNKSIYDGGKHLTDDIMHKHYELLRKKLGGQGTLIVVIDACHSGESYRGNDDSMNFSVIDDEIMDDCIMDSAISDIDESDFYERGSAIGFSKNKKEYLVKKNMAKNRIVIKKQQSLSTFLLLESCLSSQRSIELDVILKDKKGITKHFYCGALSYSIYKNICRKSAISASRDWVANLNAIFSHVMSGRGEQKLVIEYSE